MLQTRELNIYWVLSLPREKIKRQWLDLQCKRANFAMLCVLKSFHCTNYIELNVASRSRGTLTACHLLTKCYEAAQSVSRASRKQAKQASERERARGAGCGRRPFCPAKVSSVKPNSPYQCAQTKKTLNFALTHHKQQTSRHAVRSAPPRESHIFLTDPVPASNRSFHNG